MTNDEDLRSIDMASYHLQEARALFNDVMRIVVAPYERIMAAPYERMCTVNVSKEDCVLCGEPISWGWCVYRNLETWEEEEPILVHTACSCTPSSDPYEEYNKPEPVWSNPGSLDGEWLYPVWRTDHWEFEARCMPC